MQSQVQAIAKLQLLRLQHHITLSISLSEFSFLNFLYMEMKYCRFLWKFTEDSTNKIIIINYPKRAHAEDAKFPEDPTCAELYEAPTSSSSSSFLEIWLFYQVLDINPFEAIPFMHKKLKRLMWNLNYMFCFLHLLVWPLLKRFSLKFWRTVISLCCYFLVTLKIKRWYWCRFPRNV